MRTSVLATLAGLAILLSVAAIRDHAVTAAQASQLTWRQQEIIIVRAKVHGCQDNLGLHRSPVAERVIRGGWKYRRWVLRRWQMRLELCTAISRRLQDPVAAIMAVWGPTHGPKAVEVARCETGGTFDTNAQNGQYLGLFQMGSWARSRYGHSSTALGQARAAYANFRENGWSQWACA